MIVDSPRLRNFDVGLSAGVGLLSSAMRCTLRQMVCKSGRPQLSADQDRKLFSESAGTCLICSMSLFPQTGENRRSIPIAERAHIVAHSDTGPRADPTLPATLRNDPDNLVLLCPTCHTIADKAPHMHPADVLLERKANRSAAVALVGGTPEFTSRERARAAVKTLLDKNALLFERYGPDPEDGGLPSAEAAAKWTQVVISEITPNHELIVAMVTLNPAIADDRDRREAELLRQHSEELKVKHVQGIASGVTPRFPPGAEGIFA